MKIFDRPYRWIKQFMSRQPPRQTDEKETIEVLRKANFYDVEAGKENENVKPRSGTTKNCR